MAFHWVSFKAGKKIPTTIKLEIQKRKKISYFRQIMKGVFCLSAGSMAVPSACCSGLSGCCSGTQRRQRDPSAPGVLPALLLALWEEREVTRQGRITGLGPGRGQRSWDISWHLALISSRSICQFLQPSPKTEYCFWQRKRARI